MTAPSLPPPLPNPPHIPVEGRGPDGRILPGFGGRKPGSKNKRSRETLAAVQDLAPDAIAALRTLVRQHSWPAVKFILDATLPAFGRSVELDNETPEAIITAMSNGDISPTEAAKLATAMSAAMGASEMRELKNQMDDLEQLVSALRK